MRLLLVRIAVVTWWLGAIVMSVGVLSGLGKTFQGAPSPFTDLLSLLPLGLLLWAVSFVLGGSFWRPPKVG